MLFQKLDGIVKALEFMANKLFFLWNETEEIRCINRF